MLKESQGMEKQLSRLAEKRGGADALRLLLSCPCGRGQRGLVAQKEPLLEPRDLCCALFYGRVTRPLVSVHVKAPLQTGIGPSAICCRSRLK